MRSRRQLPLAVQPRTGHSRRASLAALGLAALSLAVILSAGRLEAATRITPTQAKALVAAHLSEKAGYRRGDLISRADVEPIFNDLMAIGVQPYDNQEELYDSFLPENSFLVTALGSPKGIAFMRQVVRIPGAYDRLERLSWIPEGRAVLDTLIQAPDGLAKFQRLCSPEGMRLIAQQLGQDTREKNFGLPTGHIHTQDQLERRLEAIMTKRPAH